MKNVLLWITWPLRSLLAWLLALVIVFEEWGWEPLQRGLSWLAIQLGLKKLGEYLAKLPPYAALVTLALPSVLLVPFKLAAFALIAKGHAVLGAALFIVAKIVGTAVIARVFTLVQPQLMQLAWFARLYAAWKAWKDRLLARVRASRLWRAAQGMRARVKAWVTRWTQQ